MAECVIFIEGSRKTDNGDLRNGFGKLLGQATVRQRPQVIMGDDTDGAIRLFQLKVAKPDTATQRILLLVDLDGLEGTRTAWLTTKNLLPHAAQVFFMVQKMEAWFLSQPTVLHHYYGPDLPHALPAAAPALVPHPDQALERCTIGTRKGRYHKTRDGACLLPLLHLPDLQTTFPDVARLVKAL